MSGAKDILHSEYYVLHKRPGLRFRIKAPTPPPPPPKPFFLKLDSSLRVWLFDLAADSLSLLRCLGGVRETLEPPQYNFPKARPKHPKQSFNTTPLYMYVYRKIYMEREHVYIYIYIYIYMCLACKCAHKCNPL